MTNKRIGNGYTIRRSMVDADTIVIEGFGSGSATLNDCHEAVVLDLLDMLDADGVIRVIERAVEAKGAEIDEAKAILAISDGKASWRDTFMDERGLGTKEIENA